MSIEKILKYIPLQYKKFMKKGDASLKQLYYLSAKSVLTNFALHSTEQGISGEQYLKDSQLVVSLTTYSKRLYDVYLSIESIMQQTMKPNRIILWLSDNLNGCTLPLTIQKQIQRGLEVRYCKNLRSYNKLIPTLSLCPQDAIITIDDDVIYRFDMIENLVNAYKANPNSIYCNRMHRITLKNSKAIMPYNRWKWEINDDIISPLNFPTGCGGILYPSFSLSQEVLNEKVFLKICPLADDVWFKAMALLNNFTSKKVITQDDTLLFSEDNQDIALNNANVAKKGNDAQIKAVFDYYHLYDKLK